MDYEWLWVILAVGVLAPVGVVPFALARDACCWWREHRRERREREMAGVSYEEDIVRVVERPAGQHKVELARPFLRRRASECRP